MSPQSLRYPSPASGDDAAPPGRHRRPESLAEAGGTRSMIAVPAPRPATRASTPTRSASSNLPSSNPAPARSAFRTASSRTASHAASSHPASSPSRSARSAPSAAGSAQSAPSAAASSWAASLPGLDKRRTATVPRHSVAVRGGGSRRPPIGSHRAPGTLPIETWLLIGSKRQQVLLASLIAAALLLIAIPMRQNGIDAVNAAAGVVGGHASGKQARKGGGQPGHDSGRTTDPRTPSPAPKPSASASAKDPANEAKLPAGQGPAHSLRTTGSQAISLTFDDGPDAVQTPKILALLGKYRVKATFCLVGQNVERHPEIVREIVADGHTLCNHTWDHSLTIGRDQPDKIRADLARTSAAIQAAAPGAPIPFFRAPGGNFTDRLVTVARSAGMTSLYWAVDPRDWDHPTGEGDGAHIAKVISQIRGSVQPGSIILSHDFNQPDTIEAYAKLLPWLTANFQTTIPGEKPSATPTQPASGSPSTSPTPATPDAIVPTSTPPEPAADN